MGTGREQQKGGTKNPKKKQKLEKEEDGGVCKGWGKLRVTGMSSFIF